MPAPGSAAAVAAAAASAQATAAAQAAAAAAGGAAGGAAAAAAEPLPEPDYGGLTWFLVEALQFCALRCACRLALLALVFPPRPTCVTSAACPGARL
jgi:hypothetical protein